MKSGNFKRYSKPGVPYQAQLVFHKQEPLGKWSQGKSRTYSFKIAMGKEETEVTVMFRRREIFVLDMKYLTKKRGKRVQTAGVILKNLN
ncbi:hypothetical protein BTVI_67234 [Pitangus sulphuratus]|nr:hypothetical protein BTVI_67234 [Pitangus sulphuratus]